MAYRCLDISRIDKKHKTGTHIFMAIDGITESIQLSEQKTGFGSRKFFVCPKCYRRTMRLYTRAGQPLLCAKCSGLNLYKPLQNSTKGGLAEITYRMDRYGVKHGIRFCYPFNYADFADDPRSNDPVFRRSLLILQALENMRMQNILLKTVYSQKTIRAVLAGKHPILSEKSLYELQRYLWKFSG